MTSKTLQLTLQEHFWRNPPKKVSKRVCALGLLASRGGGSRGGGYNTKQLYGLEIVK